MAQIYNKPTDASKPSSIGSQFNTDYWDRRSLVEVAEEMFFSPLAHVKSMPKHYGKELKVFHYIPLLDDRNVSDQGIDAQGASILPSNFAVWVGDNGTITCVDTPNGTAEDNAILVHAFLDAAPGINAVRTTEEVAVTLTGGMVKLEMNGDAGTAISTAELPHTIQVFAAGGNLYGSSKDIGYISNKMPALQEDSERVNRVGFTRIERKGEIAEYGFFTEFTEDSLTFDSDSELYGHMSSEMLKGANEINEDLLQADLLNSAGIIVFPNGKTSIASIEVDDVIGLRDLKRVSIALTDNRTPKKTTIIKGSKMTDTRVISAARILYIGSELQMMVTEMLEVFTDGTNSVTKPAFVPVEKYADAGTLMNGEIGAIPSANLRVVVVPNMMMHEGGGAKVGADVYSSHTAGRADVCPMLIVGDESFATIGLQSAAGGKSTKQKFKIIVKKPGKENATRDDPYGKFGFSSISFWYGFIVLRPERIAVLWSASGDNQDP